MSPKATSARFTPGKPGLARQSGNHPAFRSAGSPAVLQEFLGSRAGALLTGVSVYREPADGNAVLFQVGEHDWTAARGPDLSGPAPTYRPPEDLTALITACTDAGLLIQTRGSTPAASSRGGRHSPGHGEAPESDQVSAIFVEREIASEIQRLAEPAELARAHRRAARYWQWRAAAWPQGRHADLRDLLEAREHLIQAGDLDDVSDLTEAVCDQLKAWKQFDRAATLVRATLDAMPLPSARRAQWLHELGAAVQTEGDHATAADLFRRAVAMSADVGDSGGVVRGHESLGVLAHAAGDYRLAERHYRTAAAARRRQAHASASPGARQAPAAAWPSAAPPVTTPQVPAQPGTAPQATVPQIAAHPAVTPQPLAQPAPPLAPARPGTAPQAAEQPVIPQPVTAPSGPAQPVAPRPATAPLGPVPAPPDLTAPAGPAHAPLDSSAPVRRTVRRPLRRARQSGRPGPLRPAVVAPVSLGVIMLAAGAVAVARVAGGAVPAAAGTQTADEAAGADPGHLALSPGRAAGPGLRAGGSPATAGGQARGLAAAWVASQVSRAAMVACDPAMCAALRARGFPAGDLLALHPDAGSDPLGSDVVVATTAERGELGGRLAAVYAPLVIAQFGTGSARIEVRVTAPGGAAAYDRALRSDQRARAVAGAELVRNRRLSLTPSARRALAGGLVDARVMTTIAVLADTRPVRVLAFGDSGPGAAPGAPLRSAQIAGPASSAGPAALRSLLAFLRAQRPPYLAGRISTARRAGQQVIDLEFSDPSPLGLLTAGGAPPAAGSRRASLASRPGTRH